jgi:DNA (cytosine-5)-methyltransferase 1
VFVVGHLGDWKPAAEVLFESESLRGDIKKGRGKEQDTTTGFVPSVANTLQTTCNDYSRADGFNMIAKVYENHPSDSRVKEMGDVCSTVTKQWGTGGGNVPFVQNVSYALQGAGSTSQNANGSGYKEEQSFTLNVTDVHGVAYGFEPGITKREGNPNRFTEEMSPTLRADMGDNQVATIFAQNPIPEYYAHQYCQDRVYSTEGITPALNCSQAHKFRFDMAVRRLTPVECERLQGFPDNYTNIPKAADGNRYKALGNSMAVPVMRWIGERINQYEQRGVA